MKARALCLPVICLPNIPVTWDHVNITAFWSLTWRALAVWPKNVLVWLLMCSNSSASSVCNFHPLPSVSKQSQNAIGTWGKLLYTNESRWTPHWKLLSIEGCLHGQLLIRDWLAMHVLCVSDPYNWLLCTRTVPQIKVFCRKWNKCWSTFFQTCRKEIFRAQSTGC